MCFLAAAAAPGVCAIMKRRTAWFLAIIPATVFIRLLFYVPAITAGETVNVQMEWAPYCEVYLSLHLDGLSLLFALLISGIGALVLLYAEAYMQGDPFLGRLYCLLCLFMGSMLGLVLADNFILMFIFWELTSISSYLLIGYNFRSPTACAAAWQSLLITAGGGLALLLGLLLLGSFGPCYEFTALQKTPLSQDSNWRISLAIVLILIGAFTKSAQFPFHFWLPNAMQAPTPVSAYLHSATMVKAGVYLVARLSPTLGHFPLWTDLVCAVGGVTMATGACLALGHSDLKRILAFTTVSSLGVCTLLLGLNTPKAALAAVAYLTAHALYKGALFMIAGIIEHESGVRSLKDLGGLRKAMPVTAIFSALAGLSMAGIPPCFGFAAKELLYEASLGQSAWMILTILSHVFLFTAALRVAAAPFVGGVRSFMRTPHDPGYAMLLSPAILGVLGLLAAATLPLIGALLISAADVIRGGIDFSLKLWHGPNVAFFASLATIGVGALLSWQFAGIAHLCEALTFLHHAFETIYEGTVKLVVRIAEDQTRHLQSGYLPTYLFMIVLFLLLLTVPFALSVMEPLSFRVDFTRIFFWEVAAAIIVLIGTLAVIRARQQITAIAALGVVGYALALFFLIFGAPDLAITQFAIETLSVILFLAVFHRLPPPQTLSTRSTRMRDVGLACLFGGFMTVLTLVVTSSPLDSRLAPFFAKNSYLLGKGRNVVNVILVDFRALDTMGEIAVIVVAALGVFALLKLPVIHK